MIYLNEIAGGLLIGLASALPLLLEGRIAGVSGYAEIAMRPKLPESRTALAFVVGLITGGFVWNTMEFELSRSSGMDWPLATLSGLLVGFGSRVAGGCTSGHGVCGLGRLSPRSFHSVLLFMGTAILVRYLWGVFQ